MDLRLSRSKHRVLVRGLPPLLSTPSVSYIQKVVALAPGNLLQYLPLADTSGVVAADSSGNGRTGAYTGGYTLNQTGIGDGGSSVLLDGSTGYINGFSASLGAAFNGNTCTLSIWVKGVAAWGASAYGWFMEFFLTGNRIELYHAPSVNVVTVQHIAGGVTKTLSPTITPSVSGFDNIIVTINAGGMTLYFNGVQVGTISGLGTYVGAPVQINDGAFVVGNLLPWSGNIAHCAIWNTVLTAPQIAAINTVP